MPSFHNEILQKCKRWEKYIFCDWACKGGYTVWDNSGTRWSYHWLGEVLYHADNPGFTISTWTTQDYIQRLKSGKHYDRCKSTILPFSFLSYVLNRAMLNS